MGRPEAELLKLHAEYCKVVANESRLAMLYELKEGELSVGDLAERVGLSLTNVSQHLRLMRGRGLVNSRRDGRTVYYSVANQKLVTACQLIREALVEQRLADAAIIIREEPDAASGAEHHGAAAVDEPALPPHPRTSNDSQRRPS